MCSPSLFFAHKTGRSRGRTELLAAAVFGMKNEQHMHGRQLERSAAAQRGTPGSPGYFSLSTGALSLTLPFLCWSKAAKGRDLGHTWRSPAPVSRAGSAFPAFLACPEIKEELQPRWNGHREHTQHNTTEHSCCQQQRKHYPRFVGEGAAPGRAVQWGTAQGRQRPEQCPVSIPRLSFPRA